MLTHIQLHLLGNAGAPARLFTGKTGLKYCVFPVAVDAKDRETGEKTTTWVQVSVLGKHAEALAGKIKRGTSVYVVGVPSVYEYKKKDGTLGSTMQVKADFCSADDTQRSMAS